LIGPAFLLKNSFVVKVLLSLPMKYSRVMKKGFLVGEMPENC